MLPVANNILDQLLGGFDTQSVGVASQGEAAGAIGAAAEAGTEALDFNLLLMQLGAGFDAANTVDGSQEAGLPALPNLLNNDIDLLENRLEQPAPELTLSGKPQLPTLALPTDEAVIAVDQTQNIVKPMVDGVEVAIDDKSLSLEPKTARPVMPEFLSNASLRAQVQMSQAIALKPGLYQIVDTEVKGDRLEMTLVPPTDAAEPIKVTLPVDLLKVAEETLVTARGQQRLAVDHTVGRIPLTQTDQSEAAKLGDLLSKMNLKTLEVSTDQKIEQPASAEQSLKVTLVAEQSGQEVAIKTKLKESDVRARSVVKINVAPNGAKSEPIQPQVKIDPVSQPEAVAKTESPEKIMSHQTVAKVSSHFDLAERFEAHTQTVKVEPAQFSFDAVSDKNIGPVTHAATEFKTPQVKLSLPENINKPFSAGGQTIMLKIEPDHLGPARLILAIRQHLLTARVIVDTPMARMAVENSLDQLTQQLSRAGLEVDRIEVLLSGDGAREQFFDRRPGWSHARKLRQNEAELEIDGAQSGQSSTIMAARHEYVSPAGIDVRA